VDSSRRLPLRPRREDGEVPESEFPEVNEQEDDKLKDKEILRSRPRDFRLAAANISFGYGCTSLCSRFLRRDKLRCRRLHFDRPL
jgi:hypothetical protein